MEFKGEFDGTEVPPYMALLSLAGELISEKFELEQGMALFMASSLGFKDEEQLRIVVQYLKRYTRVKTEKKPLQNKQCFQNCVEATDMGHSKELRYVEGVACSIIPLHHAWLTSNGSDAIDITWKESQEHDDLYFGLEFKPGAVGKILCQLDRPYYGFISQRQAMDLILENPEKYLIKP